MRKSYRGVIYFVALCVTLCVLASGPPLRVASSSVAPSLSRRPEVTPSAAEPLAEVYPPQAGYVQAVESGDPDAPPETVTINEAEVENLLRESHSLSAFPAAQRRPKDSRRVAEAMLNYALELAGKSPPVTRANYPWQIRRIVGLYDLRSENVPFCAMGIAYAAARAYCGLTPQKITYGMANETSTLKNVLPLIKKYYFAPHPLCQFMVTEAKKRISTQMGGWIAKGTKRPQRGWLVVFDWGGDGVADHIGIVRSVGSRGSGILYTVEFNTCIRSRSGKTCGAVAKKERSMSQVMGFIRTYTGPEIEEE